MKNSILGVSLFDKNIKILYYWYLREVLGMQNSSTKNEGSWIFISHSSKDIEKIRLIRNEFEKWGQNPLAFHLKCLNTDTTENEKFLFDLIKKEIEARNWFVYCESDSAQNSKYVQLEREYVEKIGKIQIWRLDLSRPIDEIMLEIRAICTRLQVFLSYARKDYDGFIHDLIIELKDKDFSVWDEGNISPNSAFVSIYDTIESISKKGFFFGIITENSLDSKYVWRELEAAKRNNAEIIILIFGDIISLEDKRFANILPIGKTAKGLAYQGLYSIPCIPQKRDMYLISDIILSAIMRLRRTRESGLYDLVSETLNIENRLQEKLNYENKYHPEKPVSVGNGGALLDYCEYYKFPCCDKLVVMGNGEPSQYRFDGCKNK